MNAIEYDSQNGDIYGQIQLSLGEHEIGFVSTDIPFGNKPLCLWLGILVEAAQQLSVSGYVLMTLIGSRDQWVELVRRGRTVEASLVRYENGYPPFILTKRPDDIKGVSLTVSIGSVDELMDRIRTEVRRLVDVVTKVNPALVEARCIKTLQARID